MKKSFTKKKYQIYKITNIANGLIYIGQTTFGIKTRLQNHFYESFKGSKYHKQMKLHLAMATYGKENFKIELIEEVFSKEEAEDREQYWIEKLKSQDENIGYNVTGGGHGGKNFTSSTYKKIFETKRKNNNFKLSKEAKEKISKALKGKPKSEIHKHHLSEHHRLRMKHVLFFKDGHAEVTSDPVAKIAKERLNTSSIKLRRASEVGDFRLGEFYLLDIENFEMAFNHKYRFSKEKNIYDPIKKDIVSHNTMRARNHHHPQEYKGINLYNFCGETLIEKNKYIEEHKKILELALKGEIKK